MSKPRFQIFGIVLFLELTVFFSSPAAITCDYSTDGKNFQPATMSVSEERKHQTTIHSHSYSVSVLSNVPVTIRLKNDRRPPESATFFPQWRATSIRTAEGAVFFTMKSNESTLVKFGGPDQIAISVSPMKTY